MSDELVIDLSNYKDRMGSHVEPGTYRVQIEDAETGKSAQKGTPQIQVWFRIITPGPFEGQTVVDRLYLTDGSMFRIVGFMNAIGLPTPRKKLKVNVRAWVNKILEIEVADGEPYNNRVRSEVRGYNRASSGTSAASSSSDEFEGLDEFSAPVAEPETVSDVADLPDEPEPAAQAAPRAQAPAEPADEIEIDNTVDEDGSVDLDNLDL